MTRVSRVLLVTNDFPPRRGGIQSYLHELVLGLVQAQSHSVTVYAPRWRGPMTSTLTPHAPVTGWYGTPAR